MAHFTLSQIHEDYVMPFNWGGAGQGAASGATAGSAFGPWGAAAGGIAGGLLGGFTGNSDPTKKANKYLDQIPDEMRKYLQPYIDAGMLSLDNLRGISSQYEKMYQDPNAIISGIAEGYTQSPGYQWRFNQGENAINNAAAAGGMAGTAQHQQQAGELATNLASQDFNDFMNRALGVYGSGLTGRTGIEQDIFGKGYGASGDLAASLANVLKAKAGLSYQGAAGQNAQMSDALSSLLSYFGKK